MAVSEQSPTVRRDLLRLARNTAIYGFGQVLLRFVSLLLLPVFTAYLTPAEYGISSILGVFTFLVTPVVALGISGALGVVYFESEDAQRRAATIWTSFALVGTTSSLLAVAGIAQSGWLASVLFPAARGAYDLPYLVVLTVLTTAMGVAAQPLLVHLQLRERAPAFVAITVGPAAVSILLSVIFIVFLGRGIAGFVEAGAIAQGLGLLLALALGLSDTPMRIDRAIGVELLRLGLPLIPAFVAIFAMQQSNKYILQIESGLAATGVYTVGYNLGMLMTIPVSGFTSAWFPFFSSFMRRHDEARPLFGRVFTYYVLGFGTVSLLFFIGARAVVLLATQPAFHTAYVAVGPSALAQFLIGTHSLLLAGMYFAKEVRYQIVVQGAAAVVAIILNLILIARFGVLGAAIALALGFVAMVLFQHLWNIRRRYLRIELDGRRLARFGILYGAVAMLFLTDRDLSLPAELLVAGSTSALVVGAALSMLTREERARAWAALLGRIGRVASPEVRP